MLPLIYGSVVHVRLYKSIIFSFNVILGSQMFIPLIARIALYFLFLKLRSVAVFLEYFVSDPILYDFSRDIYTD